MPAKKVTRKYVKKVKDEPKEKDSLKIEEISLVSDNPKEELIEDIEGSEGDNTESLPETSEQSWNITIDNSEEGGTTSKIEEVVVEAPKKQHQMFHQLEEDRINLEAAEAKKAQEAKKRALEAEELLRKDNAHKPHLECPFCNNIQYSLNSKDPTSAWCSKCGRCFMAVWK